MEKVNVYITVTNTIEYDRRMEKQAFTLHKTGYNVTIIGFARTKIDLTNKPYSQVLLPLWFTKGKLSYIEIQVRLFCYLIFKPIDKFISVDMDTMIAAYFLQWFKKIEWYYDAHEYFSEVPELIGRNTTKKIWKYLENKIIPKAKVVYTVSDDIAEVFTKKFQKKVSVVYNMPYKNNTTLIPKKEKIILYQGDLNEGRMLETLVESMLHVDASCWIIGDGILYPKLKQLIANLNLQHKVILKGKVLPQDLYAMSSKCYLGFNLLDDKSLSYQYSLSNKFFDYVQALIPSINNDFISYRRFINEIEVGLLLQKTDLETIVSAFQQLLNNEDLYIALQQNCLEAASKWNWENQESNFLKIIN